MDQVKYYNFNIEMSDSPLTSKQLLNFFANKREALLRANTQCLSSYRNSSELYNGIWCQRARSITGPFQQLFIYSTSKSNATTFYPPRTH